MSYFIVSLKSFRNPSSILKKYGHIMSLVCKPFLKVTVSEAEWKFRESIIYEVQS